MPRQVFKHQGDFQEPPALVEGYLQGLSQACRQIFGPAGGEALARVVGKGLLAFLDSRLGISFVAAEPWPRLCRIMERFTELGFYQKVELEDLGEGRYWLRETGQYAGQVWDQPRAGEPAFPPSPPWSAVLASLEAIGQSLTLEECIYHPQRRGFEATFGLQPFGAPGVDPVARARRALGASLRPEVIPLCSQCHRVRQEGSWHLLETYFQRQHGIRFTHGLCPGCIEDLYPELCD